MRILLVLAAALVAAMPAGAPAEAGADDTVLTLKAQAPATVVRMLAAPHVGRRVCDIPASTPVRFIARAAHGPHVYARVEVLEGACAGREGYVPWAGLDPEPAQD